MGQRRVGPVLSRGAIADACVAALTERHREIEVADEGAYLRVSVPGHCVLMRDAAEAWLGRPFRWPDDLERSMPAFEGTLRVFDDRAEWRSGDR